MLESTLIKSLKCGDEKAFDILFEKYYRLIYYIVAKYIKDIRIIEELVNDVFLRVYNSISKYDDSKPFKVWISVIAKNIAINEYNRIKKENIIYDDEYIDSVSVEYKSSIEIESFLSQYLDEEEKEIVEKIVFFDYKFKEVSFELNLKQSYVQTRYYRAIKKLKLHWKDYKGM